MAETVSQIAGIPVTIILTAIGVVGSLVGFVILTRAAGVEGEARPFRASAWRPDWLPGVAALVLAALVGMIAGAVAWVYYVR
jgi:hypothetical protein